MTSIHKRESAVLLCALAFILLFGYAIARPSSESLFLELHGAGALPWAWLGVALTSAPVVGLYNRAAARSSLGRVMMWALTASAASLVLLLGLSELGVPGSAFVLYVWKDVYIVVLLEVLWSFANLTFDASSARWVNGIFCAAGSLGGLAGNMLVGQIAQAWGTRRAPLALLPLFLVAAFLTARLASAAGHPAPETKTHIGIDDALALLRESPYVSWLVLLIGTVQLVVNLVDFVFADTIARAYPEVDARTSAIGQIYGAIDVASLTLQLASGVVIATIGVRATLISVPALLGTAIVSFLVAPRFALMALTKVASKAFDYSLFRTAKEMLYLPLSYADKTRGKALVDMLTYRVAKGAASVVILGLGALGAGVGVLLTTLGAIAAWLAITLSVTRRHRALTARATDVKPRSG